MNRPLFREEAVKNKTRKLHGSILLTGTWQNSVLAGFLCMTVVSLIAFSFFFGYSRKVTANGTVIPSKGITRVISPQSGTLAKLLASEGQTVKIGDPLLIISSDKSAETGDVQVAVRDSLIARIEKLNRELDQQGGQSTNKQREITDKLTSLSATMRQLDHELDLQQSKVLLARDVAARVAELAKSGNMSKITAAEKETDVLEQESRLSTLEVQRQSILRDVTTLQSARTDGTLQGKRDSSGLQRQIEDLKQQLAENEAKRQIVVRSEVSGKVAAILAEPGQAITANQRLASVLPADSELEVELYMPSRNVGMVARGTPVVIRYDSFPYQKFGQFKGTVKDVSETAISYVDLPTVNGYAAGSANGESVFRVRVSLPNQLVHSGGKHYSLKPGMQLSANVLLEQRTIAEWMFAPLVGIAAQN